ncbi:hypothetical protein [Mesorhizobium sp. 1B3]|uniref:hypothetical protein n=1 Tax=Mesorhizobium sp. 1B3 TaxID=3243599 RepID=UPI003D9593A5
MRDLTGWNGEAATIGTAWAGRNGPNANRDGLLKLRRRKPARVTGVGTKKEQIGFLSLIQFVMASCQMRTK